MTLISMMNFSSDLLVLNTEKLFQALIPNSVVTMTIETDRLMEIPAWAHLKTAVREYSPNNVRSSSKSVSPTY